MDGIKPSRAVRAGAHNIIDFYQITAYSIKYPTFKLCNKNSVEGRNKLIDTQMFKVVDNACKYKIESHNFPLCFYAEFGIFQRRILAGVDRKTINGNHNQ